MSNSSFAESKPFWPEMASSLENGFLTKISHFPKNNPFQQKMACSPIYWASFSKASHFSRDIFGICKTFIQQIGPYNTY
jgi:hypothetical protein